MGTDCSLIPATQPSVFGRDFVPLPLDFDFPEEDERLPVEDLLEEDRLPLDERLADSGAILFRGLPMDSPEDFSRFYLALDYEPMPYHGFASRDEVAPGVTTGNKAGPGNTIMLHNDMGHDPGGTL